VRRQTTEDVRPEIRKLGQINARRGGRVRNQAHAAVNHQEGCSMTVQTGLNAGEGDGLAVHLGNVGQYYALEHFQIER
jgi:hypothetical protein